MVKPAFPFTSQVTYVTKISQIHILSNGRSWVSSNYHLAGVPITVSHMILKILNVSEVECHDWLARQHSLGLIQSDKLQLSTSLKYKAWV